MSSRGRRLAAAGVAGVPLGVVVLLGVQALIAASVEHQPTAGYEIDAILVSPSRSSGPPLRLAVLGDSTVAGVGSPSADRSLPVLVAERVAQQLGRPVEVTGVGVSGARSANVRDEQIPLVVDGAYDVIVIVIGSNDVTHLTSPRRMERDTREMLESARAAGGGAPVVLGGIPLFRSATNFPQPLRSVVDAYARPLRARQSRAAGDVGGITWVDISQLASPRFEGVPEAMSQDRFHPSPVGYGFWADALAPAVASAAG